MQEVRGQQGDLTALSPGTLLVRDSMDWSRHCCLARNFARSPGMVNGNELDPKSDAFFTELRQTVDSNTDLLAACRCHQYSRSSHQKAHTSSRPAYACGCCPTNSRDHDVLQAAANGQRQTPALSLLNRPLATVKGQEDWVKLLWRKSALSMVVSIPPWTCSW